MNTWREIESAPKDGTAVLLYRPTKYSDKKWLAIGRWDADKYANKPRPFWRFDETPAEGMLCTRQHKPTHWMPLPEPPQ